MATRCMTMIDPDRLRDAGFEDRFEAVEEAVAAGGNLAVVGPPFSGKEALLDHVESSTDASVERLTLSSLDVAPDLPDAEVVVIEDAHYLFRRRIDGFGRLDTFLEDIAGADACVVTSWNLYAWRYLAQVRGLDRVVGTVIETPTLGADDLRLFLETEGTRFVDDRERERTRLFGLDEHSFTAVGHDLTVPLPAVRLEAIRSWREADEPIEEVIYGRLASLGDGIPGVVQSLWERSVDDGRIGTGTLYEQPAVDIDTDEALVLQSLVFNEAVDRDELGDVVRVDALERVLRTLANDGLVRYEDGEVAPAAAALPVIVDALERRRLVW